MARRKNEVPVWAAFDPQHSEDDRLGVITTDIGLDPTRVPNYLNLSTGQLVSVAEAERLDQTLAWPYTDPDDCFLERRVVLGANLIAYRKRPHHYFYLATYDGSELPKELASLGNYTNLSELLRALTPFNLELTITGVNP